MIFTHSDAKIDEVACTLGVMDLVWTDVTDLSGGQRTQDSLAAIAWKPDIFLDVSQPTIWMKYARLS